MDQLMRWCYEVDQSNAQESRVLKYRYPLKELEFIFLCQSSQMNSDEKILIIKGSGCLHLCCFFKVELGGGAGERGNHEPTSKLLHGQHSSL